MQLFLGETYDFGDETSISKTISGNVNKEIKFNVSGELINEITEWPERFIGSTITGVLSGGNTSEINLSGSQVSSYFSKAGTYSYDIVFKYPYAINKIINLTFNIESLYDLLITNHQPVSDDNNIDRNTYNIATKGAVGFEYKIENTVQVPDLTTTNGAFPIDYINTEISGGNNIPVSTKLNYIYNHDIITSSWTGGLPTENVQLKFLTPNWPSGDPDVPLPTKQFGLFGIVGTSGKFTATVITDLLNTNNEESQVTYPLTSNWEIDMDYIADIETSSIPSSIELTNKVQTSSVTPIISLDTNGLAQKDLILDGVKKFSFISVSKNLSNIEFVSTQSDSSQDSTPAEMQFEKSKTAEKISGETVFTFYPANSVSNDAFPDPIKISSGDYTINIKYNFCDYNVTLNGLPSSETSENPIVNISGYVGVEYDNLAELSSGIARNYETNYDISPSALSSKLTINNSDLNLSLIDNTLMGYTSGELNGKIRKYRN